MIVRCPQCLYCGTMLNGSKQMLTVCRRYPPIVRPVVVPTPAGVQLMSPAFWPQVTDTDGCAEGKPNVIAAT